MNILLDENVTDLLMTYLNERGHDVESIKNLGRCAVDDDAVMQIAIVQRRILVTQNGKDFIIHVPPRGKKEHYGIFWFRTKIKRSNHKEVGKAIEKLQMDISLKCMKGRNCDCEYCDELINKIYKFAKDNNFKIIYKNYYTF